MAINGTEQIKKHRIDMSDRTNVCITGICDVINFDESSVVLDTSAGILSIDGQDLHIVSLNVDSGDITVSGSSINGIIYPQSFGKSVGGLFRKKSK
jgi:sporulation protein YabP